MSMDIQGTLKVVSTTSDRLGLLSVDYGQLIFVKDTRELYFDHKEKGRTIYNDIIIIPDENFRLNSKPVTAFYYVKETGIIWRYENEKWKQITSPPSEQIEFLSKAEFPNIGDSKKLYIDNTKIYRWLNNEYVEMGVPMWETFS